MEVVAVIQEYLDIRGKMEIMGRKMLRLYLTDWQKREMMDEAGVVCSFIELEKGTHCEVRDAGKLVSIFI